MKFYCQIYCLWTIISLHREQKGNGAECRDRPYTGRKWLEWGDLDSIIILCRKTKQTRKRDKITILLKRQYHLHWTFFFCFECSLQNLHSIHSLAISFFCLSSPSSGDFFHEKTTLFYPCRISSEQHRYIFLNMLSMIQISIGCKRECVCLW